MKQRLANFLKYNKVAYWLYSHIMSCCINVMKLFIQSDSKLILFNSFAGRSFDDSPKAIFDVMKKDRRFSDYKLVWAFHQPDKYTVESSKKIRTDGLTYFKTALAARVWITNSSVERGLSFRGKNTLYFNTWHGTPMKKMGKDINAGNNSFGSSNDKDASFDVMMSQGQFETDVFSRSFGIPKERFLEVGLPRNDVLAHISAETRESIRNKLGISKHQTAVLYCPTFREYEKDEHYGVVMKPPMDLGKWTSWLGSDYVLLIRAHYEVSNVMNIRENDNIRNMTGYPNLNELFIAADVLVSDYSSVFFDYSITGKPMIHFTYDYDEYSSKRGMYFDIRDYLNGGATEDEILTILQTMDVEKEREKTIAFRDQYVNFYGNAAEVAVDYIAKKIM